MSPARKKEKKRKNLRTSHLLVLTPVCGERFSDCCLTDLNARLNATRCQKRHKRSFDSKVIGTKSVNVCLMRGFQEGLVCLRTQSVLI